MEENKIENSSETINSKKPSNTLIAAAVIIFVLGLILYLVFVVGDVGVTTNYITYENYTKIHNGMSYSEVVSILGNHEGTLDTTASSSGYTLSYYSWTNPSGSRCIVIGFENGKVCAKSQYGLS